MLANLIFDLPERHDEVTKPNFWLVIAVLLSVGYIAFALVLIGVPGLARGGAVFAVISLFWMIAGLAARQITFPPVLFLPLAFYIYTLLSGFFLSPYPTEYMGQMTTIWVGGIVLAVFVANGVSINLIIAGFVVLFAANMAAIAMGYDGHLINVRDYDVSSLQSIEIQRYSGLAGQSNLLISLVFTLPFLLFLRRKKPGFLVYVAVIIGAIATTILSGSRSAVALTAFFAVSGAVFLIVNNQLRNLSIAAGLVGVIIVGVFITSPDAASRVEHSRYGRLVIVKRVLSVIDGEDQSAEVRKEFATEFWPYFSQQPIVGHGPNAFSDVTGAGTYAHNNFAEIAVNWGLVGLLLYYSMYLATLFGISQSFHYRLPMIATLIFLVLADRWFVIYLDRAMVLCLCLLLVKSHASPVSGRSGRSKHRRRRRRVSAPGLSG